MIQFGQVVRLFVFIGFINIYMNYIYQYCYKYLTLRHHQTIKALGLGLIVHVLFSFIVGLFFLIVLKSHHQVNRAYRLDRRLRKLFENYEFNTDLTSPPELTPKQSRRLERFVCHRRLNLVTRNSHGQIAICLKCQIVRPDRCYHCHKCNRCILKRNHHCPWFHTCIGFSNHKYYLLLLVYVQVYLIIVLSTLGVSIMTNSDQIVEITSDSWIQFIHFRLTFVFAICLLIFVQLLIINNFYLVSKNMTFLELVYPPRLDWSKCKSFISSESLFDLGNSLMNLKQIFGDFSYMVFLPIWTTPGNGHEFALQSQSIDDMV